MIEIAGFLIVFTLIGVYIGINIERNRR